MKITGKTDLPAATSSKVLNFTPDSDLLQKPISRKQPSRRTRNPADGVRLKRDGAPAAGKRGSRPETPLLRWKFDEGKEEDEVRSDKPAGNGRNTVSARKLAAGIWRLRPLDVGVTGAGDLCNASKHCGVVSQPKIDHREIHFNRQSFDFHIEEVPQSPNSVSGSRNKFLHKLEPTFHFSNSAMEGATKWDPSSWKASKDVKQMYDESKLLEEQAGMVLVLESKLESARARIHDLETERRASKKKLEQFLKKLNEERATWRSREHEKIRAVIDDMKTELTRERKTRQRMEIVNSKLVNELADAKLSAKQYMQDYEKERKARELAEEVCDELAKELGEDRAEIEALKQESMKMREEVDDERKMLQMAEVWREERVQLKLVDAKVTLEEKYSQMNRLIKDLEAFLISKRLNLDAEEIEQVETLMQYANSVNIQDINEFKYVSPDPNDIFSVFEEVNIAEMNVIDVPQFDKNGGILEEGDDDDDEDDDESGWETVSHLEDHGSNYSPNGSDTKSTWEENHDTPVTKITEMCSVTNKNNSKKGSAISRLWKSSYSSNGEHCKVISIEGLNGRLSNETHLSNGTHLSQGGSSVISQSEWSCSPGSGSNTRVTKGCIEWPKVVTQKNSLKAKLMEARMETQKVQLRHMLKQKM
ncbi:hypothetical protein E3N88_26193 [Mikania micrantha]|uniref:Uncharacterized protein n=1 Tax=Mikania micrantha TaxID=192012 RepID=A0A5N6N6Z9_9ASTR|nr:hypothetical protein E3N88_26193 [Mikania micrantha]